MDSDGLVKSLFEAKYKNLDPRYNTMKRALEIFNERFPNGCIVETGCARQANDWGAGLSTVVFCDFLSQTSSNQRLTSVDISQRNVNIARDLTSEWDSVRNIVCEDSVTYFERMPKEQKIDLLYLDSWDYPIIEIADLYGPREDFEKNHKMLAELTQAEVLYRHGDMIAPSQIHCLKEIVSALPHLTENSVVLIDDVHFPGGGKSRLAEQHLRDQKWTEIMRNHQSLWVHESTKEASLATKDATPANP